MENASKALIMAASVLIGVMIIAFMVYMFTDAAKINKRQELRESEKSISKFNADFVGYETTNNNLINTTTGKLNDGDARFNAAKELNKIADVISAVNEAHDINYKNSNRYQTDYIEYTNAMVIVIDLKSTNVIDNIDGTGQHNMQKYVVFPHPDIKAGYVYGMSDAQYNSLMSDLDDKKKNIDISGYQEIETSKFLEFFRESRLASKDKDGTLPDNKNYTLYKYYFSGELHINDYTSKIDRVTFTLVEDGKF